MLLGIDPLLPPELLMVLRAMGHGDDIARGLAQLVQLRPWFSLRHVYQSSLSQ